MSIEVYPDDLLSGDTFIFNDVSVEIISSKQPHVDPFGREQIKFLARRADTGQEGYMIYGPGAIKLSVERPTDPKGD
jgi:hypothetical protein